MESRIVNGHRIDLPAPDEPRVSFSSFPRPEPVLMTLDPNGRHEPAVPFSRPQKVALEKRWCTSTGPARQIVSLYLWLMAKSWIDNLSSPYPPKCSALKSQSYWCPLPLKRAYLRSRWMHCWRCLEGTPQREECNRVVRGLVPLDELTWYPCCNAPQDCEMPDIKIPRASSCRRRKPARKRLSPTTSSRRS